MAKSRNMVVAQSGGPSPVINNSLRGIIEQARQMAEIGTVYGARHGIEGVLKEELLDLSSQPAEEVSLLRYTPAAGSIGTCRYKLRPSQTEDFDRAIEVFKAHNIGYFLYIGGNDSMDTANKVAALARERGLDLAGIGVPKTIDNDVGDSEFKLIDHTPGYGSVAKFWMHTVQTANEENEGSSPADPVLVMQAMGRKIGYIPAAARLADPNREMPLQIYLAESPCTLEQMADQVNDQLRKRGRCMVVVSEGFNVGELGEVRDSFGHTMFSSSQMTVTQAVVNYLNRAGLAAKGAARGNVAGTDQRNAMALASTVDLEEAYRSGQLAAILAATGESGHMATILRNPGPIYNVRYDKVPLDEVANSERTFPAKWIAASGCDVTDEFVRYAKPLVGEDMLTIPLVDGRFRMTRFQPKYATQKLAKYVPQADRKNNGSLDFKTPRFSSDTIPPGPMFEITKQHNFLVGIDSDGCAFDTMEVKHKECFIPNIVDHYNLAGVSKYLREAAEFVNLYSKSRGINRFPALIEALELVAEQAEVKARGVAIEIPKSLVEWIRRETKLANPALEAEAKASGDPHLKQALAWSKGVNQTIEKVVRAVPPFPHVRECLEKLLPVADLFVVSATPNEALKREWEEHDLARYVCAICGQEEGTKKESLANAKKYAPNHTLMIGDAPGDQQAATANAALFFPINPGHEDASWKQLYDEGIDRFLSGAFAGEYQEKLIAKFDTYLPEKPPWKKK